MAKKDNRLRINLKCSQCGMLNHTTEKNKMNTDTKISIKKNCPRCNKTTVHNETAIKG